MNLEDRTLPSTWIPEGPAPIINGAPGGDPSSGRITALAADPSDPNTIYVAAAAGGVWKTTDGGQTWKPLTDDQPTLFMGAIALARSDPNTIYAGTGEADNSFDSFYGRGVLKSLDGGATWTLLGNAQFDRKVISKIVVDPTNPDNVYMAVGQGGTVPSQNSLPGGTGIWKSTDGGITWTDTTTSITTAEDYSDLIMDPADPEILFAAVGTTYGAASNGIYETKDGGNSWTVAGNFPRGTNNGNTKIAMAPTNDSIIYASIATHSGGLFKMMKSINGGTTWTLLPNTPNYMGAQGWYDSTLAVDPTNADIVYAGGQTNVIRTVNGGAAWVDISSGANGHGPHGDHHAIGFDASGRLLDGNDGGIWRLDSPSPVRWTDLNTNLQITEFIGIALDPSDPNIAYGGSQDNGTSKFTGSLTWNLSAGGDGGFVRVDFQNPDTVYHSFMHGHLERSENAGATWVSIVNGIDASDLSQSNFYPPFIMGPSNSARLLLGVYRIYETTNHGDSWEPISPLNGPGWGIIDSLAVAPSDGNTIYAAAGSNLFVTNNDGMSWSQRSIPGSFHDIQSIAVDPTNSQIAYAVRDRFGGGHVFRTINGGTTWSDISGNLPDLPTYTIVLGPGTLYVGNDEGVYSSTDLGATWSRLGDGLPHALVHELVLNTRLGILAAGTYGRGLWELSLGGPATHFSVVPSMTTVQAGTPFSVAVTALDALNNPVAGYMGTVHFQGIAGATLPGDYTFAGNELGTHTFQGIVLTQVGNQIAIDQSNLPQPWTGGATNINPGNQMGQTFEPGLPILTGVDIDIETGNHQGDDTITIQVAKDGQVLTTASRLLPDGFDGLAHFDLPSPLTVEAGQTYTLWVQDSGKTTFFWKYGEDTYPLGTSIFFGQPNPAFDFRFQTYGIVEPSLVVTDTVTLIRGEATITLTPAPADHFAISAPAGSTAGTALDVTVTALDPFNNIDVHYQGTVHFTTTDAGAGSILPSDTTFTAADAGAHTFSAGLTLVTAGNQAVLVTDTRSGISGTVTVAVTAGTPDHLIVTAPTRVLSGLAFDITVLVQDAFNNRVMTYVGTVQFTSTDTDPSVMLPSPYTFNSDDAGVHAFVGGATLITVGSQTITVDDPSLGIAGTALVEVTSPGEPPGGRAGQSGLSGGLFAPGIRTLGGTLGRPALPPRRRAILSPSAPPSAGQASRPSRGMSAALLAKAGQADDTAAGVWAAFPGLSELA